MSRNVGSWVLVGVIALLQADVAAAQDTGSVPVVRLAKADVVFPEPFSNIAGVRELADGRVVVADRLEVAVRILDFSTGGLREIGSEGRGPGEFRQPGALLGLPGDSTLLVDFGNMQMLAIAPDGRLVEMGPLMRSDGVFVRPTGTDARGRIYFEMLEIGAGPASLRDSQTIVRWERGTGAIDNVATTGVVTSMPHSFRVSGGNVSFGGGKMPAYPVADAWGVAPDGRVAVARAVEYHLEWWPGGGPARVGPVVEYAPVPVSEEDKQARVEQGGGGVAVMMMQGGGGAGGRGGGRTINMPQPEIDDFEWPEVKPAFPRNAVTVAPNGEAWVLRHVAYGEPETHDVFDAAGRRVRQVMLPAGRRLVGFGGDTAYAVYTDDDDLQWLERYRH